MHEEGLDSCSFAKQTNKQTKQGKKYSHLLIKVRQQHLGGCLMTVDLSDLDLQSLKTGTTFLFAQSCIPSIRCHVYQ